MTPAHILRALELPAQARIDQRVPKKLLVEQSAPTAADKRRILDGIEEMVWVAALKPSNIAVPAFRSAEREYLEIAVLTARIRPTAKATRLAELIHRAIPYPVVLLTAAATGGITHLSLAHKRWSQVQVGAVVLEELTQVQLDSEQCTAEETSFVGAIAISRLPGQDLFALYQGLLNRAAALEASRITGAYVIRDGEGSATLLRENLDTFSRLKGEVALLKAQAKSEKQLSRRVQLNLRIKELENRLREVLESL